MHLRSLFIEAANCPKNKGESFTKETYLSNKHIIKNTHPSFFINTNEIGLVAEVKAHESMDEVGVEGVIDQDAVVGEDYV